ncbi:MAG: hypothetical protein NVSMB8_02590 [Candidatus Limnocylindrales bacterium]
MSPTTSPLMQVGQLERAINRARWAGVVLAISLSTFYANLGPGWVAGFVIYIGLAAVVAPRVRNSRVAHAMDAGIIGLAMLVYSPDPQWTTFFLGVLVIITGAFRFGRRGALTSAVVVSVCYLAIGTFRQWSMGYQMEPHRIGFHLSVYLLSALLMAGLLWELQALRDRTAEQTDRYEALLRAQSDLGQVVILTEAGRPVFVNEAYERLIGRSAGDVVDVKSLYDLIPQPERAAFREQVEVHVRSGRSAILAAPIIRADGERRYLEIALKPFGSSGGRLAIIARDVTDRTYAEDALAHQALHDILTGLPNRTLLHDRLDQAVLDAKRRKEPLALLLLDLDEFKAVNDSFGHHIGDLLLTQVGPRLQAALRETDTVARLGGDEFAVLLPGGDLSSASRIATTLLKALERPFIVENESLLIGASIGVAMFPEHGDTGAMLMRRADIAMYAAKEELGNTYIQYAPEQDHQGANRLTLINELRNAIENDQLRLEFQPQVSLRNGRVTSVEALVRWDHPDRGLISPAAFIPLAEQTGIINPLTEWVLERALRTVRTWHEAGQDVPVAVNLSTRNLLDPLFPQTVADLLRGVGVAATQLRFEITESVLMAEPERAMATLGQLRAMGVQLALDDFGTGYSSLAYLSRLPLQEVKIDRSFVQGICSIDDGNATIVQATVDLGHRLGFAVVAEGVETQESWDRLVELGCDIVQGFHIARPMPGTDVLRWLGELRPRPADRRVPIAASGAVFAD